MRVEGALLDLFQVAIANIGVIFDKLVDFMDAVSVEVLHQLLGFHQLVSLKVDSADDLSVFDALDLLLDVGGMVENALLHLLKPVDLHLTLFDVFVN